MRLLCCLCILGALVGLDAAAAPLSSRFTYQGVLEQSGAPASGSFDLSFQPFGLLTGGTALAPEVVVENVVVTDGAFSVPLDFGEGFFVGDEVFLSIGVRSGASTGAFTTLAPRQPVTATPYALTAMSLAETGTGQSSLLGRLGFTTATININADSPSIAIGGDGFPIISFYDPANGDLRVLHCEDLACATRTITTIDSTGIVGEFSSIAILANGLPAISYYNRTNGDLKLAYCLTRNCASTSIVTVDSAGDVGQYANLVAGDRGFGAVLIFYYDASNGDLKSAACFITNCTSPTLVTLDSAGDVGQYPSAAIGIAVSDAARVWVAYYAAGTASVKIAGCSTFGCGSLVAPVVVQAGVSAPTSIGLTIGGDLRPWVGYNSGGTVRVARCDSPTACTSPAVTNVAGVNGFAALSTGIDGVVWFGGLNSVGRPRLGRCTGLDQCTGAVAWTMTASNTDQTSPVSIARGVDGSMVFAATYGTSMRIFHCGSPQMCADVGWPR